MAVKIIKMITFSLTTPAGVDNLGTDRAGDASESPGIVKDDQDDQLFTHHPEQVDHLDLSRDLYSRQSPGITEDDQDDQLLTHHY